MDDKNRKITANQERFNRWSSSFENKVFNRFNFFQFFQKRVVDHLHIKAGQRLLDLGCGTGWAVRYAAGLANFEGEFVGVDISPGMVERARAYCATCPGVHFENAGADVLPLDADFFDFVICTNAFHHFNNPGKVVAEVHRVLKTGGRLCILDVTADDPILKFLDIFARKWDSSHVKIYSSREYRRLFADAGLAYLSGHPAWRPLFQIKVHQGLKK